MRGGKQGERWISYTNPPFSTCGMARGAVQSQEERRKLERGFWVGKQDWAVLRQPHSKAQPHPHSQPAARLDGTPKIPSAHPLQLPGLRAQQELPQFTRSIGRRQSSPGRAQLCQPSCWTALPPQNAASWSLCSRWRGWAGLGWQSLAHPQHIPLLAPWAGTAFTG